MPSRSEEFESTLESAEQALSNARGLHDSITETETVPEAFIQSIRKLEDQINQLARETTVDESILEISNDTRERTVLLAEALEAFQVRQRFLVEQTVDRLQLWTDELSAAGTEYTVPQRLGSRLQSVQESISILEQLLKAEQHTKAVTNDRITPSELERNLRHIDAELRDNLAEEVYTDLCLDVVEKLLVRTHGRLNALPEESSARTAFSSDLGQVKDRRDAATNSLESGNKEKAVTGARTALEGALMVDELVTRAETQYEFAQSLGEYLVTHGFTTDEKVSPLVVCSDTEALVDHVTDAIGTETELTVETRVQQLLEEYDGSVSRTVKGTELDTQTILDQITQMYTNGQLADVVVEFDK